MSEPIIKHLIPVPFMYHSAIYDGYSLPQSNLCRKCDTKDCFSLVESAGSIFTCSKGFSNIKITFLDEPILFISLITDETRHNFAGMRWKQYKKHYLTTDELNKVKALISNAQLLIETHGQQRAKDSVSFLHDVRTSVGIVLTWAQKLIDNAPGASFEDKLEKADLVTSNLFNSISLLQEQLDLADIIANPEAVQYGQQYRSGAHKFIYKMVKLFEPRCERHGNTIRIEGKTFAEVVAYNSFQFIPLIFLDNAVKYSKKTREIVVSITELPTEVQVIVSSYGPVVPKEYCSRIFDKYVRGPNVKVLNPHGMGLGLYMAQLIATAHGTRVWYECSTDIGNGTNKFGFTMKKG